MAFYKCHCFFTKHIFVDEWRMHVSYPISLSADVRYSNFNNVEVVNDFCDKLINKESDDWLLTYYNKMLKSVGCISEHQINGFLKSVHSEIHRRVTTDIKSSQRIKVIQKQYVPLNTTLFSFKEEFLHSTFLQYYKSILNNEIPDIDHLKGLEVYYFPVFTEDFCNLLLSECENFHAMDMPFDRPNTMNRGGLLMSELGLDPLISELREKYLPPIIKMLLGEELCYCDSHRAFTVHYKLVEHDGEDADRDLALHYDNSEVTLNIHIGGEYKGNQLYFMRNEGSEVLSRSLPRGCGVLHPGAVKHRVSPLLRGERTNLIIWLRASSVRNKCCPRCQNKPILMKGLGFADGFTEEGIN